MTMKGDRAMFGDTGITMKGDRAMFGDTGITGPKSRRGILEAHGAVPWLACTLLVSLSGCAIDGTEEGVGASRPGEKMYCLGNRLYEAIDADNAEGAPGYDCARHGLICGLGPNGKAACIPNPEPDGAICEGAEPCACAADEPCEESDDRLPDVPSTWTCNEDLYSDGQGCDCECGVRDPDCDDPTQDVYPCGDGETCNWNGECEGGGGVGNAPAGWTCNESWYGDGQGCDCECGVRDPDCDDPTQDVYPCGDDQTCWDSECVDVW
jgi:hypothetical protein